MLIATYASAAIVCALSLIVGRAALCLFGRERWTGFEPAVGLATLLAACSLTIRLPHRATTTLVMLIALLLASLLYLRGRLFAGASPRVAIPVALLTLLFASIPFIAAGRISVLGIGVNNDLAGHLHYAAWLEDPTHYVPKTIRNGYPLGPHGLVAAIAKGLGAEPLSPMLGLLLSIPVLTALTAASALRRLRPALRVIAALLTGLTYLAASTLAIGGFKETIMGLLVLGFALALRELTDGDGDRRGVLIGLGVLMAGMLGVYSFPGLAYPAAVGGIWALLEIVAMVRRGQGPALRATVRRYAPLALIPLAVAVVIGLAELSHIRHFAHTVSFVQNAPSRIHEQVSPWEAFGAWPSGDFLLGAGGLSSFLLYGLVGAAAFLVGLWAAIRDRERALIAGAAGVALIYVGTLIDGGFYVQAKALVIAAPIAMLLALKGLLSGRVAAGRRPPAALTTGRAILAIAFVGIAAVSSFLALRDARVAPRQYAAAQLSEFRRVLHGKTVLSLTSDRFTDYYLRGASVFSPAPFAEEQTALRGSKLHHLPVDFDSVAMGALDRFDYAITTGAAYKSAPPSNFKPVARTRDFVLWKRIGSSPQIGIFPEQEHPGSQLSCTNPKLRGLQREALKHGYTTATVQPRPVIGKRLFWQPGSSLHNGRSITQTLQLPRGRWQLSLQYYSPILNLTVDAGDLHVKLVPTADGGVRYRTDQGPYWPLGTVDSSGRPITVTVSAGGLSSLQKLLGVDLGADIGNVTAAQPDKAREVPLRAACGLYVDHYTVGPG